MKIKNKIIINNFESLTQFARILPLALTVLGNLVSAMDDNSGISIRDRLAQFGQTLLRTSETSPTDGQKNSLDNSALRVALSGVSSTDAARTLNTYQNFQLLQHLEQHPTR